MASEIRVGVVGLLRGAVLARAARRARLRVTAVCDLDPARREAAAHELGAAAYAEVDALLEHPLDAVILANHFDEHAPPAIRALELGRSVLSETAACRTIAEGVALTEAAERSGGIYMFAENYPYTPFSLAMRERYRAGDIGELRYAEAEYLHSPADLPRLTTDPGHWRARISATSYCTHSIAPVTAITGTRPVEVSGTVIPLEGGPAAAAAARRGRGGAALLTIRLDSGAVLKALHGFLAGGQWSWVRLHGDRGLLENLRGDQRRVRMVLERPGEGPVEEVSLPTAGLPATLPPLGDGAAELLMLRDFAAALRRGEPPEQDVHFGVATSVTGIQALRSVLQGGAMTPVPDLRDPAERRRHAGDEWIPRPAGDPPPAP